ncbi:MAG: quinone-dependent dihydroorotate dehydrogenase [Anaerolineales bacterium]|nr:quinone-dependent dihydroorotate dehydrogenase [Anaerolineales bacterium]
MMYHHLRPLLFRLKPETAHELTLWLLRALGGVPPAAWVARRVFQAPDLPVECFGLKFRNPVGLAAGYDKDGLGFRGLACLGFGHVEVGTVTKIAQPGNPKPRVFRLVEDRALINRMGFPGRGAEFVARRMRGARPGGLVLGVNLGKNRDTPLDEAALDYLALIETFAPLADYLAINISSPNTPELRRLQGRGRLESLLAALDEKRREVAAQVGKSVPLLIKLAPDLTPAELDEALDAILACGMDGVIAANTSLSREGLRSPLSAQDGGLSGAPITELSLEMVRRIVRCTDGKLPVIGVGGVMGPDDARRLLDAGAKLVQIYTGLVYAGPELVKEIVSSASRWGRA